MIRSISVVMLVLSATLAKDVQVGPDPTLPPIKRISDLKPGAGIFDASSRDRPIALRTKAELVKFFPAGEMDKLLKQVDLTQQFLLVFAWRGSGQDRLETAVLESYPEQIVFTYKPGRTRDLRPHIYIYAVRSNVKLRNIDPRGGSGRDPKDYLAKSGLLKHALVLRDSQSGFAGESGHVWTIEPDGNWSRQPFLNQNVRAADRKGKFTKDDLGQLARQLAKSDLLSLPQRMGKAPGANPHVVSISFGKQQCGIVMRGGDAVPAPDRNKPDAPEQRFASVVRYLESKMQSGGSKN